MAKSTFVRYPDSKKDDPKQPGDPNPPMEITASALPGHIARGFEECDADGKPVKPASGGSN